MVKLGITGSSGCGKSTISKLIDKNISSIVFDSDKFIRGLDFPNSEYLNDLQEFCSEEIIKDDGYLDRKKLARLMLENKEIQNHVNKVTKTTLLKIMNKFIEDNKDKQVIILDIPILFENKLEEHCDKVLAVISSKEEQIERICKRDGIAKELAENRLKMQKDNSYYCERADFVIENINKSEKELEIEFNKIIREILK